MKSVFNTIEEAIEDIKQGKMIIVVDDEDRENEGDLVMAAEKVTPEAINFMITHGRGLVCLPMTAERIEELGLPQMVNHNSESMQTAFTVSIDSKYRATTGISAHDRCETIKVALDPNTVLDDLARPGHVFPLKAKDGGVLKRTGHTEASVDLARLAGLYPAGVICEIINPDGTMARVPQLIEYAKEHGLKMITVADLIKYRVQRDNYIKLVDIVEMPTKYGKFKAAAYESELDQNCHLALIKGDLTSVEAPLVRVHSECLTGDVFGSLRCDCGEQFAAALKRIDEEGVGVVLYMRQEGRGIGLANKIRAYKLQEQGRDTVQANEELGFPADLRDYGVGAQILVDLGIKKMRLLTNNPRKIKGLEGYGLEVIERVPIEMISKKENVNYLATKKCKLGHLLGDLPSVESRSH
jgi:3,4-dihydroxy 2-butanone 4-phosphate synthase/GTP cyclohydrolase II